MNVNAELSSIFNSLKSRNVQVQEEASNKLFQYLQKHGEETDNIFEMFAKQLQSQKKEDKLGCFTAMNKILKLSRETSIIHYVNKILPVMRQQMVTNDTALVEKGAECLGNLAEMGGAITAQANDETLAQAIKWLRDDTNPKSNKIEKYSAVLLLREYARKLPIITFNKLFDGDAYRRVFDACRDHRENVRMTAAECINHCIRQITERNTRKGHSNQTKLIYDEVENALKSDSDPFYQHSALSILVAIIQARDISKDILKVSKHHKSLIVIVVE